MVANLAVCCALREFMHPTLCHVQAFELEFGVDDAMVWQVKDNDKPRVHTVPARPTAARVGISGHPLCHALCHAQLCRPFILLCRPACPAYLSLTGDSHHAAVSTPPHRSPAGSGYRGGRAVLGCSTEQRNLRARRRWLPVLENMSTGLLCMLATLSLLALLCALPAGLAAAGCNGMDAWWQLAAGASASGRQAVALGRAVRRLCLLCCSLCCRTPVDLPPLT